MHVVLLETSGNQSYIFATNKLRENVGASELTYRSGTAYVRNAIADLADVRPVVIVSGKAILLVTTKDIGKQIISSVTRRALREAPGLDVRGVVGSDFHFASDPIHDRIKETHFLLEHLRSHLPGPNARFQRLPVVAECATSGLPAARIAGAHDQLPEGERGPRSAQSLAKLSMRSQWQQRVAQMLNEHHVECKLADATTELEELGCDWVAVVHADGNGLGQVFLEFDQFANGNEEYVNKLSQFSTSLDRRSEAAFCAALQTLKPRKGILPIVPLVLGGDDLTVVMDGRQAMRFVKCFLDEFEGRTTKDPLIAEIMGSEKATKQGKVTSCAGVAIVKPPFPFHAAYELAEGLLKEAKRLSKDPDKRRPPFSAIDFHVLYDASGPDLDRIRDELMRDDGKTSLVARPYATADGQGPPGRNWQDLFKRLAAVNGRDEDSRRLLPNGMLHELREGLFFGRETAEARLALVRQRYEKQKIHDLLSNGSLFWQEGERHITALLDAMDLAEFWEGQS